MATGDLTLTDFLKDYGHRAVDEFELAQPRWREDTTYLEQIVASFRLGRGPLARTNGRETPSLRSSPSKGDKAQQIEQRESAEKDSPHVSKINGFKKAD